MLLKFSDLFDGLGTGALCYSELCKAYSGTEIELAGYLTQAHVEAGQVLLVDQPGACPDCSPAPVACLALPGFTFASTETPVQVTAVRVPDLEVSGVLAVAALLLALSARRSLRERRRGRP